MIDHPVSKDPAPNLRTRLSIPTLLRRSRSHVLIWLSDPGVRAAVFPFTVSRVIIVLLLILASNFVLKYPERRFGIDPSESYIELTPESTIDELRRVAVLSDGGWLYSIACCGYEPAPFDALVYHNWAFLPFYPLLWRAVAFFTGGYALTSVALSTALFFFGLIAVYKTALAFGEDSGTAERAVFYLAIFPLSYFFSLPRTESLFLLLSASCFLAARRERWGVAGILGALACITRVNGILLLPSILILYFQQTKRLKLRPALLWLLLMPLGIIAFMIYLKAHAGNAFAFLDVQAAWGHKTQFFLFSIGRYLKSPAMVLEGWDLRVINVGLALLGLAGGVVLGIRKQWAFAFYTIASVLLPLSTISPGSFQSLGRYVMVVFPLFYVLARAGASRNVDRTVQVLFLTLLGVLTVSYGLLLTFALS